MPSPTPEPAAGEAALDTINHDGYGIAVFFGRAAAADGSQAYNCRVTATPLGADGGQRPFERTLVLGEAEALVNNVRRPGNQPPLDQLETELTVIGTRYVALLIDLVSQGFDGLAPYATRSVTEVWTRIGMTDQALRLRER